MLTAAGFLLASIVALAAEGDNVDVRELQKKYFEEGPAAEVQAVQNRQYTLARKIEIGAYGGSIAGDPFLTTYSAGGTLGYHFNEVFGFGLLYWKDFVSSSSALRVFERANGFTVNTNKPMALMGGELMVSPMYGKFSLFSKAIIYVDVHLSAGAGMRQTESGNTLALFGGVGTQIFLTRFLAFRLNYRLLRYTENILEKVDPALLGTVAETRVYLGSTVTAGFSFLIGLFN